MRDKTMSLDGVVAELRSGMTLGIGGWGSRRKPMALVRAIARSELRDLTLVTYGGPDVGMLCAVGKVRHVVTGFVSLDTIPLEPHYRRARESGTVTLTDLDEGMLLTGLRAAAQRLPFLPTRAGLGSDVQHYRTIRDPYTDEELVAMPALRLDAAIVHLNVADRHGNGDATGPDPYFDDLFCLAAERRFASVERIVATADLPPRPLINRMMLDGVVPAPHGAHFTSCAPDYDRDEAAQRAYAEAETPFIGESEDHGRHQS